MVPYNGPKSFFKGDCVLLHFWTEKKFEGFTQDGCFGNQPETFEVVFHSINANTFCYVLLQNKIWLLTKHIM